MSNGLHRRFRFCIHLFEGFKHCVREHLHVRGDRALNEAFSDIETHDALCDIESHRLWQLRDGVSVVNVFERERELIIRIVRNVPALVNRVRALEDGTEAQMAPRHWHTDTLISPRCIPVAAVRTASAVAVHLVLAAPRANAIDV